MLKMTGVTLGKILDPDKYMFFEQGMRAGVSYINKDIAKLLTKSIFSILIIYMDML